MNAAEREREYAPSSCIGGHYAPFIAAYAERSRAAHAMFPWQRDIAYGEGERAKLDFLPAKIPSAQIAGLLVFIHGGYWQELSKNESAFLSPAWHTAGFAHAVLGYTLAPAVTLPEIVAQCCAALRYLHANAQALGFDAENIVIAGSSAGGYLAAAVAAKSGVPIRGIVPVSGVFDVAPLIGTSINGALGLDAAQAADLNLFVPDLRFPPAVVAVGEIETNAFKQQSKTFAQTICAEGTNSAFFMEIPARNHFDVIFELGDANTALFAATRALFKP